VIYLEACAVKHKLLWREVFEPTGPKVTAAQMAILRREWQWCERQIAAFERKLSLTFSENLSSRLWTRRSSNLWLMTALRRRLMHRTTTIPVETVMTPGWIRVLVPTVGVAAVSE
jgi:hypothetical protein